MKSFVTKIYIAVFIVVIMSVCIYLFTDFQIASDSMVFEDVILDSGIIGKESFKVAIKENTVIEEDNSELVGKSIIGATDHGKSGVLFGTYPGELFAISMTGEGSGAGAGLIGDGGRAYGLMQFDYRYALVPFMQYAYSRNQPLWLGFSGYINYNQGDQRLVNNSNILSVFENARSQDNVTFLGMQCDYFIENYFKRTKMKLLEKGIDLEQRHVAVSAAILSLNVNCGEQAQKIANLLTVDMSDKGMIEILYANRRNGNLKSSGKTNNRWKQTSEEAQCLALLDGSWIITEDYNAARAWSSGWKWSSIEKIYFAEK